MASTIATRLQYGLRADETWVREVAIDPAAQAGVVEFGIPLTPAEAADIRSRRWSEDLFLKVRGYCLSVPDDCASVSVNLRGSGVLVDMAHDVERHRKILSNLVADPTLVEITDVEWSRAQLLGFIERVELERAWFDTIGAQFIQAHYPGGENLIVVDFIAPTKATERVIEAHFGHPTWLRARWAGAPPWTGPRADLTIEIRAADGRPAAGMRCVLTPVDERASEGFSDAGFSADAAGVCRMTNLPAVLYKVQLIRWVNNDHDELAKEFRVAVRPGGTRVEVVVPTPPQG